MLKKKIDEEQWKEERK